MLRTVNRPHPQRSRQPLELMAVATVSQYPSRQVPQGGCSADARAAACPWRGPDRNRLAPTGRPVTAATESIRREARDAPTSVRAKHRARESPLSVPTGRSGASATDAVHAPRVALTSAAARPEAHGCRSQPALHPRYGAYAPGHDQGAIRPDLPEPGNPPLGAVRSILLTCLYRHRRGRDRIAA